MSAFADRFLAKGEAHFGSGWVWVLAQGTKLAIEDTHDADNPLVHGKTPILVCDVWEHAYYLDTKNDRKAFLTSFLGKLVNWEHAATLFAGQAPGAFAPPNNAQAADPPAGGWSAFATSRRYFGFWLFSAVSSIASPVFLMSVPAPLTVLHAVTPNAAASTASTRSREFRMA